MSPAQPTGRRPSRPTYLEKVLVHARAILRAGQLRLLHLDVIQRVFHARVIQAKGQLVHGVAEIHLGITKRRYVMHVHAALLVRPPRRKVEVACHLVHLRGH